MELTQLQWAKTGYVLNEDAEGKERWTNCYHNAKAVYYSESEVHPDPFQRDKEKYPGMDESWRYDYCHSR